MVKEKKTNVIRIYSKCVNKHGYCSKCVYLHIYTPIDVGSFLGKMCKFDHFLYNKHTSVIALNPYISFLFVFLFFPCLFIYFL